MRVEDKIAVVLEEMGIYDPQRRKDRLALRRAKKRIDKIEVGEERSRERELDAILNDAVEWG
jgi:hypothetical protein